MPDLDEQPPTDDATPEPAPALNLATLSISELAAHIAATYTDSTSPIARLAAALLDPERERAIRHAERLRLADLFESNAGLLNQYAESSPVELVAFLLRLDHG